MDAAGASGHRQRPSRLVNHVSRILTAAMVGDVEMHMFWIFAGSLLISGTSAVLLSLDLHALQPLFAVAVAVS